MRTLRSLAATGDRARGFLKHRDTESTEKKHGEEARRRRTEKKHGEEERRRRTEKKNEGGKTDGGKRGLGIKRWARREGGKKSVRGR
jgi:hypothetical protein